MTTEPNPTGETPVAPKVEAPEVPTQQPAAEVEEPFDKDRAMATIHSLREIEKQAKKNEKELEKYRQAEKAKAEAEMTEVERLKKQADEVTAQNAKLQADLLRRDVVAETGLPAVFADRLKGNTKEELLADAQELLKVLPKEKVNPKLNATNPDFANRNQGDLNSIRSRRDRQSSSLWEPSIAKELGGGVIVNDKE